MEILISRNGKRFGPYSKAQVIGYLTQGHLTASDLAWHKGIPKWAPLGAIMKLDPLLFPRVPSCERGVGRRGYSNAEITAMAGLQKIMIRLVIASNFGTLIWSRYLAHSSLSPVLFFIRLALVVIDILALVFTYRLAKSLRSSAAWAHAVFAVIPVVGFIILLILNAKASEALRRRGIRVGLMGADEYDLEKLKAS